MGRQGFPGLHPEEQGRERHSESPPDLVGPPAAPRPAGAGAATVSLSDVLALGQQGPSWRLARFSSGRYAPAAVRELLGLRLLLRDGVSVSGPFSG